MTDMPRVHIYTDGACKGNPGPGGYGAILKYGDHILELSGGFRLTTNNRMELIAVVKGLEELKKPCIVNLYSDSKYVVDAFNSGWIESWLARGWRKSDNSPVKNYDLWKHLLNLVQKHRVTFFWVKGHASNDYNNRCDRLAVDAYGSGNLPPDEGYENEPDMKN